MVGLHWGLGLLPAVLVISVICIPYLTKATETSPNQVPGSYRDGAEALAPPVSWTLRKTVVKSAVPGIVTYPVWTQHASPYKPQQYLACNAALLLFVLVLIVIILGRAVAATSRRHAE